MKTLGVNNDFWAVGNKYALWISIMHAHILWGIASEQILLHPATAHDAASRSIGPIKIVQCAASLMKMNPKWEGDRGGAHVDGGGEEQFTMVSEWPCWRKSGTLYGEHDSHFVEMCSGTGGWHIRFSSPASRSEQNWEWLISFSFLSGNLVSRWSPNLATKWKCTHVLVSASQSHC